MLTNSSPDKAAASNFCRVIKARLDSRIAFYNTIKSQLDKKLEPAMSLDKRPEALNYTISLQDAVEDEPSALEYHELVPGDLVLLPAYALVGNHKDTWVRVDHIFMADDGKPQIYPLGENGSYSGAYYVLNNIGVQLSLTTKRHVPTLHLRDCIFLGDSLSDDDWKLVGPYIVWGAKVQKDRKDGFGSDVRRIESHGKKKEFIASLNMYSELSGNSAGVEAENIDDGVEEDDED